MTLSLQPQIHMASPRHPQSVVQASDHPSAPTPPRFLAHDDWEALVRRVMGFTNGRGSTQINVTSRWSGDTHWARNRADLASDSQLADLVVLRQHDGQGRSGQAHTNQLDDASLRSSVHWAERMWRFTAYNSASETGKPEDIHTAPVVQQYTQPHIWSATTYDQTPEHRGEIVRGLIRNAEHAGMLSAGLVSVEGRGVAVNTSKGVLCYAPQTIAQCSLTVRDPQGTGSGWAGASSYDWTRFDADKLADIALDKCLRSRNPVAIEPGRYTLILEPQATFDLVDMIMAHIGRLTTETTNIEPFYDVQESIQPSLYAPNVAVYHTKIGQQLLDERITISHDPMDPDLGVIPFTYDGDPYVPVTWFDKGVLVKLAYDRNYAVARFKEDTGYPHSGSYRMSGGTTSIEEMIATTKRGLIVTRFAGLSGIVTASLLSTGLTRDGLWLIENGKISKPVKNLRFTESPLFAFNQVEQLGVPVPVFSPGRPVIVPPVKVRDFSFTAMIDAI